MEKRFIGVSLLLLLLLAPLTSAALTTADSIGAYSTVFLIFLIGVVFIVVGWIALQSPNVWFVGLFLIGFGIIIILYSLNTALVLAGQLGTVTGLDSKTDRVFGKVAIGIKILSGLVIIAFLYWGFNYARGRRESEKPAADGWDGGNIN